MTSASETPPSIAFGRFRLLPHRRELLADGRPIKLRGRAFDVLMALIEAQGAMVGKDALMARVWPDRVVEQNNLQAQIVALRKAFGADRDLVRTVSRRGYQFTGEIRVLAERAEGHAGAEPAVLHPADDRPRFEHGAGSAAQSPGDLPRDSPATNLPGPVSELIGRDDELREILNLAAAHRLVTLTGTGGIGKTRLALAAAHELLPQFAEGVWLAELASLSDPGFVPAAVAGAVGLELAAGTVTAEHIANALSGKHLLLLLDNCEHVIDAATMTAEALLRSAPSARIIATSREPLRAEGEQIYQVPPLAVPASDTGDENDPLQYGAVRLFVERARAAEPHFAPDRRLIAILAAICRRLDGVPLAIELAASRAAALGIEELAIRLDDRFSVLTRGRRTALPRHQTLRAMLDWSYGLLAGPERALLRRLAIFAGPISLDAATAVAAGPEPVVPDAIEVLSSLVAKSLVLAEFEGAAARYRLLDTTRAYALEKLDESGERERIARRHAEYCQDLFERAELEWESRPTAEWLADYGRQIDNLRAALDWTFSPGGDASIGVALTAAVVPLWMHLSLLEECYNRAEQALAALGAGEGRDPRCEMKLHAALAASSWWRAAGIYAQGNVPELGAIWTKALDTAKRLDDAEYQLRSLYGLYAFHLGIGPLHIALENARRFRTLAGKHPEPNDRLIGDRMIGCAQHLLGDQASARRQTEHMLANFVPPQQRSHDLIRFQFDQRVTALTVAARVLWLQGFPDQAMRTAHSAAEEARETDHALSLCYALAHAACPTLLWVEDLAAAEHCIAVLLDHSMRHGLPSWGALGRNFEGMLAIRRGDTGAGVRLLQAVFDEFGGTMSDWISVMFLSELAAGFGRAGQTADGLAAAGQAIERAEQTEARWLLPESLRIKSELLLVQAADGAPATAEVHLRRALDLARRQDALSLELRAATILTRLLRDQGRCGAALALLRPVYDRFTEGFETADLKAAKALLDALA
jgi:predicted ATPase/DNA-binding winged helix-turn-helix (wHTH) protein